MKPLKGVVLVLWVLASCREAGKDPAPALAEKTIQGRELTVMDGYPKDLMGCSCAFSRDREAYRKQEFIYLEKYGSVDSGGNFCMISLDGEPIRWTPGEHPEGFEVDLRYDSERATDQEVREIEGQLVLRFPDGKELSTPVFGTCGC